MSTTVEGRKLKDAYNKLQQESGGISTLVVNRRCGWRHHPGGNRVVSELQKGYIFQKIWRYQKKAVTLRGVM